VALDAEGGATGRGAGWVIVMKALSKGKHVVTANKLLLATEGEEIFKKAKTAGRTKILQGSNMGQVFLEE